MTLIDSPKDDTNNVCIDVNQVLRIAVHEIECVIDLSLVERVISMVLLQVVPGAPPYFAGIMNYHGEDIAVVDLGLWLLQDETEAYTLNTPIVLCGDGKHRVGFIVDRVLQAEGIGANTAQMQNIFKEANSSFLATLNSDTGVCLLLNMPRMLSMNFASSNPSALANVQLNR